MWREGLSESHKEAGPLSDSQSQVSNLLGSNIVQCTNSRNRLVHNVEKTSPWPAGEGK
jgi:hypothetical protein